jgi:rhamnosyltransferase
VRTEEVLAVVVSYNGLQKIARTVEALRGQVDRTFIVDNGSGPESLTVLDGLEKDASISVHRLGENRGIGHALNLGVQRARAGGYGWILTMDQDSVVEAGFVQAYRAAVEQDPQRACLAPRIANGTKAGVPSGEITYTVTSGNMVRMDLFDHVGLYDEGFFIDCVDFDFCLRLRRSGFAIHRAADAVMHHQLGDEIDAPAFVRFCYARHPPVRRYYMFRNFMYLAERYLWVFPMFIGKLGILHVVLLPLIGLFDRTPLASYRAIARGLWDYLRRRSGPFPERTA